MLKVYVAVFQFLFFLVVCGIAQNPKIPLKNHFLQWVSCPVAAYFCNIVRMTK